MTRQVLFICTGNLFRSVVAEYALRAALPTGSLVVAGSAGIEAKPQMLPPLIRTYLLGKGADVSAHVQRKLTRDLLGGCHLPIAMGLDHQDFIRREFGRDVRLFNDICFGRREPILDLHEALPDWASDPEGTRAYVKSVIDHIWQAAPGLLARIDDR
jgi:protein-tyrosine phosphatase